MKELVGKWKLQHDKNDNFEEYLKAVGINFAFRKMGKAVVPVEEIKQEDDEIWSLCVCVSIARTTLKFKFGEELHETTMDGRKCKTTFSVNEDGHMVQYQKSVHPNIPDTKITRMKEDENSFTQSCDVIKNMTKVIGFWKLESHDETWDEYMKAMGVGFATRQVGKRTSSWEEIKEEDGVWSLDITSTFKNAHLKFKLGEEFDETTMDGRKVKSVFNVEDEKLVHYQKSTAVGVPDSVIVRERVDDTTMTVTLEAIGKNVKAVRRFTKQAKAGT